MHNNHAFIADLHLGHRSVFELDGGPFKTLEERDAFLTQSCSVPPGPGSTLWLLGDVTLKKAHLLPFMETIRPHWNKINLIRGNHDDRAAWRHRDLFDNAYEAFYLRVCKEIRVYLSHYACRTWRGSNRGSFHIHGHSHGALQPWGRSMDAGAVCVEFKPLPLLAAVEKMRHGKLINHHTANG
jgi:calcineurin-like phosphoesterase family protein